MIRKYLWNILVSIDQFANTILGGDPDETLSSRAAKAEGKGSRWGCLLCRFLGMIDDNHCGKSREADEGKAALSPQ